ncbi:MAG: DUF2809 domain-containing protein [Bacteroides intestinalis]|nr:DUF2809 domain-containing protein [Bacteroides intestinalis]
MKNERWIYLAVTFAIMVLGLASRKYGDVLPEFIAEYSGDTLWAAMVYWGIRFLFPSISIVKSLVISLLFSYCIEISQLYQADWANIVRSTTLGVLIFGHGFLWSDMICYTVGVLLSAVIDSRKVILFSLKKIYEETSPYYVCRNWQRRRKKHYSRCLLPHLPSGWLSSGTV